KIRIRYCTKCRGVLIPMGAFLALMQGLRAEDPGTLIAATPDRADLKARMRCPHCHRQMETHFYNGPGNVIIDDCEHCELNWLDYGGVMRIVPRADYCRSLVGS